MNSSLFMESKSNLMKKEKIVIALSGSFISPDNANSDFIKKFKSFISGLSDKYQFFIVVGGGQTAREYINLLREVKDSVTEDELDLLGIEVTKTNAKLLQILINGNSFEKIITDPENIPNTDASIVLGAGWKPGASTDHVALVMAHTLNVKRVINLSNIDYIYNEDPKKNPDAMPMTEMSWSEYLKLLPSQYSAGSNYPFDLIASQKAQKFGIEVVTIHGENLESLGNYLEGREFEGTKIKN